MVMREIERDFVLLSIEFIAVWRGWEHKWGGHCNDNDSENVPILRFVMVHTRHRLVHPVQPLVHLSTT